MSNGPITKLSIGGVLTRGFEVARRNLVSFGTLSALFTLPPLVIGLLVGAEAIYIPFESENGDQAMSPSRGWMALTLLWVVLYFLLFATLTHGTICDLRGTPARIGQSVDWAFGRLFPVIGVTIVASICAVLGLVALVVPGLFLITVWWVAVPAAVVERTGVFASLGRSYALTRGHRWQVFGVIMIIYTAQTFFERLTGGLLEWAPYFSIFAGFAVTVAFTAYSAVVTAVCYHDLRVVKEGVGIDDIAKVFD